MPIATSTRRCAHLLIGLTLATGCLLEHEDSDQVDEANAHALQAKGLHYDGTEGRSGAKLTSVCTAHGYEDTRERTYAGEVGQRFELRARDPQCRGAGKYRSELRINDIDVRKDHWFGFSVYVPKSIPDKEGFLFWQIHTIWDDCEKSGAPPAGVALSEGKFLKVQHATSRKRCSTKQDVERSSTRLPVELARETWHTFVIHLRMDHRGSGRYRVWHNGENVYDFSGRIGFDDQRPPYVKWGMYSYNSRPASTAVLFMDEMRIMRDGGDFAAVDPRQSRRGERVDPPRDEDDDMPAGHELALNRTAWASSDTEAHNPARHLVDGDLSTRWSAKGFPQHAVVDLGEVRTLTETRVAPYRERPYQFVIRGRKRKGAAWTTIVDRRRNTQGGSEIVDTFSPAEARYVRIEVTGIADRSTPWASLRELAIFGE